MIRELKQKLKEVLSENHKTGLQQKSQALEQQRPDAPQQIENPKNNVVNNYKNKLKALSKESDKDEGALAKMRLLES